jgi:DNA-binding MarR family transcriptional regulator
MILGEPMKPTLQSEIRKKKPFDLAEEEANLNLQRTAEAIAFPFERLFAEHRISGPQYNVLRILRGHGGRGLPCSEIGTQMISRMPDMTRLIDRLEQAGLVRRGRTTEDRRVVLICITDAGLGLLARLDRPVRELNKQTLGHLTPADLAELNRLLVKARNFARD